MSRSEQAISIVPFDYVRFDRFFVCVFSVCARSYTIIFMHSSLRRLFLDPNRPLRASALLQPFFACRGMSQCSMSVTSSAPGAAKVQSLNLHVSWWTNFAPNALKSSGWCPEFLEFCRRSCSIYSQCLTATDGCPALSKCKLPTASMHCSAFPVGICFALHVWLSLN